MPESLAPSTRLSHYLIIAQLGAGGMGEVYRALDTRLNREVAIKILPALFANDEDRVRRFEQEARSQLFDADRLELKGETFPITQPVNTAGGVGRFSVSENGVLIWQGDQEREYQLVWFDREGKQGGTAGPPKRVWIGEAPRLSPDGKRVAIHRIDPQTRNIDIWVIDLARNLPTRLTSDPANDQLPIWSPDGTRVVFESNKGGVHGLYQKAASDGR